jgi:hypothetical protein
MQECFAQFEPIVPVHLWPKLSGGGGYHAAIGRTFEANYKVYSTLGLEAHAIAHLRIEGTTDPAQRRLPKWVAKEAWERAKALYPSNDARDYMTEAWFNAYLKSLDSRPVTKVEHEAEQLAILRCQHHLLAHRHMLRAVEARQAARMNVDGETTGKTFPLFPLYKIRHHFAALDKSNTFNKDWDSAEVLAAFFPKRKGWEPAHQITTDGVRIALTYTREVEKREVGGNTLKDTKRRKKTTDTPILVDRPGHSSFHSDLNKPLVNIRTAPKGTYDLKDIEEDWTLVDGDWEAFDPGLSNLYTGDRGTSMSRKEWRHKTGADQATAKVNSFFLFYLHSAVVS